MVQFNVPIALICFNRPEVTKRIFEAIARIQPTQLFVIMDSPRDNHPDDVRKCAEVRSLVSNPTWPCELHLNIAMNNLGCRGRVSSGLDWLFSKVDSAIILEDDCLPDPTFFEYCRELLHRYKDDERVMHIGGINLLPPTYHSTEGYYFSHIHHIWGWATWRRAWAHYDVEMKKWPELKDSDFLRGIFDNPKTVRYWKKILQLTYEGKINTWDYQWTFACWTQNGLACAPNSNLVSNLGFDPHATHTRDTSDPKAALPTAPIQLPLVHQATMIRDFYRDLSVENREFRFPNLVQRVWGKIRAIAREARK
jgi:hypothetical protein